MNDHYYTESPQSAHKPRELSYVYRGAALALETDSGVFSRTEIDQGTEILLNALPDKLCGAVLDMGCGYGIIGVAVGKRYPDCAVTMADINARACGLAHKNAARNGVAAQTLESDGYAAVLHRRFDLILQNPPIRAGKAVIYRMFADAAGCLNPGGALWLVIRKQQGAPSAQKYLEGLFGSVCIADKQSGYWVFCCESPKEIQGDDNP